MHQLKLLLLGTPRIEYNGEEIQLERRKTLALLAYLGVTGEPASRDFLATFLWPDYDESRAKANLRRDIATLNETPLQKWLVVDRNLIDLKRDNTLEVDVSRFNSLVEMPVEPNSVKEAVKLYRDHFMVGFSLRDSVEFDEWQSFHTQQFQQRLIASLKWLSNQLMAEAQWEEAITFLRKWLNIDPFNEFAQTEFIRLLAVTGQRITAINHYEQYLRLLESELGILPQQDLTELYESIKNNQTIPAPLTRRLNNAPAIPGWVIGREQVLQEIKIQLGVGLPAEDNPEKSPLILQGWPGIGKTTLASTLAHDEAVREHFRDGVLWVALGETPNLLAELANWIRLLGGATDPNYQSLEEASSVVRELLRDKQTLLIVDDVWEIAHARPFMVEGEVCRIVFTTRLNTLAQALATKPQDVYKIPILTDAQSLELLRTLAPNAVAQYREQILELVHNLEGLPLALQVAGRMLHTEMNMGWGVKDLLRELHDGVRLLQETAPTDQFSLRMEAPPTVAVLFQRSTDKLDTLTQERFVLLGIFAPKPATFDLEAVKAVWEVDDPKPSIRALVNRGLLEPVGDGRFQMHALLVMHAKGMIQTTGGE